MKKKNLEKKEYLIKFKNYLAGTTNEKNGIIRTMNLSQMQNYEKNVNLFFDIIYNTLILSCAISLLSSLNDYIETSKETTTLNVKSNDFKEKIKSDILNTIISNPNLTVSETNYFLNIEPILEENFEYLYVNDIIKKLTNLEVQYQNNLIDNLQLNEDETVAGTFGLSNNNHYKISVYEQKSYYTCCFNYSSDSVLFHEINHALEKIKTTNIEYYKYDKGSSLVSELLTEIYTREYGDSFLSEKSKGYEDYMPLIYMLCELFEIEDLREYRFVIDPTNIKNKLLEIDNDSTKVEEFMHTINTCDVQVKNLLNSTSLEEGYFTLAKTKEHFQSVYDQYKYYYELKYDHKLIENKDVMYSIYSTMFETYEVREVVSNDLYNQHLIYDELSAKETYFDLYQFRLNENDVLIIFDGGYLNKKEIQQKGYFSSEYSKKNLNTKLCINEEITLCSSGKIIKENANYNDYNDEKNLKKLVNK